MHEESIGRAARLPRGTARAAILDATLRLIARRGVHGWTMRDVAREAHCSLGSTTYHFADRSHLLQAALETFAVEEIARFHAALTSITPMSGGPAATVQAVLREVDRSLTQPWSIVAQIELYLAATRDPAVAALAEKILYSYYQFVEKALTLLEVPPGEVGFRAKLITALVDGMVIHHLVRGTHGELAGELAQVVRVIAAVPLA